MPIANDVVTCINHPERRMNRNDRPAVLHPVELVDGKAAPMPNRGIFLAPYICLECGYVEFYAVDKQNAMAALSKGEEAEDSGAVLRKLRHLKFFFLGGGTLWSRLVAALFVPRALFAARLRVICESLASVKPREGPPSVEKRTASKRTFTGCSLVEP